MKIYANQLAQHLAQGLSPCYLLFGDEPFQIEDSRSQIKQAARSQGVEEFIRLSNDDQFNWQDLVQHCQSMSLFATKKLIELELTGSKMPAGGSEAIKAIASELGEDTTLVLFGPKLDANQTKATWFKALDKLGLYVPVYEITGPHLERWLQGQLKTRQLQMSREAQLYLLDFTRGNLLACAQELDKLFMILGANTSIDLNQVQAYVADQSRYSVFQLMDSLLAGRADECITILHRLQLEELEPNLLLWSMQKDVQLLLQLAQANQYGQDTKTVFDQARVWKNKQSLYLQASRRVPLDVLQNAIARLHQIDVGIKSFQIASVYAMFGHVCLLLCGNPVLMTLDLPMVLADD